MLRVRLLGGLEVDAGVAGADVPAGRPARLLLGWLAAFPGEHARADVAARLWPDVLDSSARASLRTALSELRGALGPAAMHLRATRETVGLGGQGLGVDLRAFSELIGAGRLEEALALCRGEVLEGLDEEWVFELRSRHAAERAEAAIVLARAAREAGDAGSALAWARRLAAWAPLDEAAERELMLALAAAGDRGAALRSYADFSRRLARELSVTPSAPTRELASRLRREELGTAAAAASGLPLPERLDAVRGDAFAGRQAAGARLHEAFARARSGERCVALVTGEAGIGKTRLLAEFAHAVQRAGALVLYGRCEEEPARPYQPFVEALAPLTVPDVLADGLGELTAAARASRPPTRRPTASECSTPSPSGSKRSRRGGRSCSPSTTCTGRIGRRCFSCAAWPHGLSASRCSCSEAPATSSCARATRSRRRSPRSGATGRSSEWPCTGSTRRPLPPSSRR